MVHYLMTCADPNAFKIGHALKSLQSSRIIADYRMKTIVTPGTSEFAFKSAQGMVGFYRGLKSTDLTAMVQAIRRVRPPDP